MRCAVRTSVWEVVVTGARTSSEISPCDIGAGTKIWHFSHNMQDSKIGARCNMGQNVVISPGFVIGNDVKIQNNVSAYTGVSLEDDVFYGSSMAFTKVVKPAQLRHPKARDKQTLARKGASMGANSGVRRRYR